MSNKFPPFNLSEFVKITCWISIICILWMWVLKIIEHNFTNWFAFLFFLITLICVTAYQQRKTS